MSKANQSEEVIDREWMELIMTARHMGFTIDEIRNFLREPSFVPASNGAELEWD